MLSGSPLPCCRRTRRRASAAKAWLFQFVDGAHAARGNPDDAGYLSVVLAFQPAEVRGDHFQVGTIVDEPADRRALDDRAGLNGFQMRPAGNRLRTVFPFDHDQWTRTHSFTVGYTGCSVVKPQHLEVNTITYGCVCSIMPEFTSQVLDSLRQPLENGEAVISRANRHVKYPSRFQLVAAANPCKCGGGPGAFQCRKGPACQANYFSRISGPFLDRIDIFVDVAPVTAMDLSLPPPSEGTAEAAARVAAAREIQSRRYGDGAEGRRAINADAPGADLEAICRPDAGARALLTQAAEQMALSARAYHRVMKVARTIADLDDANTIARVHAAEALNYRFRPPGATTAQKAGVGGLVA